MPVDWSLEHEDETKGDKSSPELPSHPTLKCNPTYYSSYLVCTTYLLDIGVSLPSIIDEPLLFIMSLVHSVYSPAESFQQA